MLKALWVFCGSSNGNKDIFRKKTAELGKFLAENNINLVYGGGRVGIMGILADAVLENGGCVYGVITKHLYDKEVGHERITKLHIVSSMHERKALMEQLSDGFLALPGGIGTLDEIIEIFTWSQLSLHQKPFGFFNIDNYYTSLIKMFRHMKENGFLHKAYFENLIVNDDPSKIIDRFNNYRHKELSKWLDK